MTNENTIDLTDQTPSTDGIIEEILAPNLDGEDAKSTTLDNEDALDNEDTSKEDTDIENPKETEEIGKEETPPAKSVKTPEQLENDRKAEAGKYAAIERKNAELTKQQAHNEKVQEVLRQLDSQDERYDAIAKLVNNPDVYETVRKYTPSLRDVSYSGFMEELKTLEPEKKNIIDTKQKTVELQSKYQDDIELERIKARQQASLEYQIPAYGILARENSQLAQRQYDTALQSAYQKANFFIQNGQDVTPSYFNEMVATELQTLNPSYQKSKQGTAHASQTVQKFVNGAAVSNPSTISGKLTPGEQTLYKDVYESLKEVTDEKSAHSQAMKIIKGN